MKLNSIKHIQGRIILVSGLAIGGDSGAIEIGGNDNPIIRLPISKEPYIPASSIKGKMRSLSEWNLGKVTDGKVHSCSDKNCAICRIFGHGTSKDREVAKIGPTRLVVRDAYLTTESKEVLTNLRKNTGRDTELKYENAIDRLTSAANPRNKERVPSTISFNFDMTYKVFDIDDDAKVDEENFKKVLQALKLLTLDGIGGGVSRGSGAIEIELTIDGEIFDLNTISIN
ncbi:MAG: type III-A CRISPR-associated RAMP protein Csm3 [Epulopiscium sp. Nele67-Bin005]|nr:MAG: type III-A CRISPR-associated RAMP protein Csm3 [Epulopiscium sp. Nele67-Bin005]